MAIVLLVATLAFFVYETLKSRKAGNRVFKKTAWMLNFNLRFLYEFFFELALCVCINVIGAKDGAGTLWGFSLILLLGVMVFVGFVTTLFFRGGPYKVPNSYRSGSLKDSIWGKRPLCEDICTE